MVAPIVVGGAIAAGRVIATVYQFTAPLVVRGVSAMMPVAKGAASTAVAAAPVVAGAAKTVAGGAVSVAAGAAKSVGGAAVGVGSAVAMGAPGFAADVLKSAVGMGGPSSTSPSLGGRLANMAKAGLGSMLQTGTILALLYYAATYLRGQLSEKFFGPDALKAGQQKVLTPEEKASFDARQAQRDGAIKMTVVKDGVPRTVSVPSIPGESEDAALARSKGWWDKQAAEGKLPQAGEGLSVQMGRDGPAFRMGRDGTFQKVESASPAGPGTVFGEVGGSRSVGAALMGGSSVGSSSEVISDPVRLGAISRLTGVADGARPGGPAGVELRDVRGEGFTAVSIAPVASRDAMRQGVTGIASFNNGADSAVVHSKTVDVGGATVSRSVAAPAGDAVGVGSDGRLTFKQDGEAARSLTTAANKVGRVGATSDSMTDALGASGRPTKGDVMLSVGQRPYAVSRFETIGPDGMVARGAVTVSEGQAKMTLLGADGRTPIATHSVKDAGFSFDAQGRPAFSGKAQDSLKAFASDPKGQMREAVGMSREDGAFKSLTTPAASEKGMGNPLQSLSKVGFER